ncbi:MAG: tRNA(Met) cytidine acetyltransferase TmcA [Cognaticolwellia sp.]
MLTENFQAWSLQLQTVTRAKRWRSLIVLVGDEHWKQQYLDATLATLFSGNYQADTPRQGLIYGDFANTNHLAKLQAVNRKTYRQFLGTEQETIIFSAPNNADNSAINFDLDALAALSGTLVAGGVFLLLLTPSQVELFNNNQSKDYFFQRFMRQLSSHNCYLFRQGQRADNIQLPELLAENNKAIQPTNLPYGCLTSEQLLAVDAMLKVLSGHRDRPLVLTADRGRGKSSALALAACQMLKNAKQPLNIIITAASKAALAIFFKQVSHQLPNAEIDSASVKHANGTIVFYPLDVLLKERPSASIVMIDEAAAFPVYLLQQLLGAYHRLIFSSTIHGYEGAGRGFSIKFRQVLQRLMPKWRELHINEAIRWANDDPLEQFVFSSALLNAKLPSYKESLFNENSSAKPINNMEQASRVIAPNNLTVEAITAKQLLQNEALLQQVFAVLVTAHYQTSPSDVQLLLNNHAISLLVLKHQDNILGVVMLMQEGQVDDKLVELVRSNQRRLRDQFLPQSLLTHCGVKDSFKYNYQRVMRIAIHPQFQGQGLGQYFLTEIEQQFSEQGVDFLGSSFGGNASLVSFWQQAGFNVARVGFSKDKASGEHSCLVTKALTPSVAPVQRRINQQFYQQFDYWLTDEFQSLPAKLVWQLLHANTELKSISLSADIKQSVDDFISGQRQFSSCVYALHQWLLKHCTQGYDPEVLPLLTRIFQKHSIEQVCHQFGFSGKKALNQHMINYISRFSVSAIS